MDLDWKVNVLDNPDLQREMHLIRSSSYLPYLLFPSNPITMTFRDKDSIILQIRPK